MCWNKTTGVVLQCLREFKFHRFFAFLGDLLEKEWTRSSPSALLYLSLSVGGQYQKRSGTFSALAFKDSAQISPPARIPTPIFTSEAQTCWSDAFWGEARGSAGECRPPCFLFCLPPISNPFHVKSAAAPQGGGRTRLWGDHYLSINCL